MSAKRRFIAALDTAGIALDGPNPWDVQVHDRRLFRRVSLYGAVGLGDAYVDGWWACEAVDQFFDRCMRAELPSVVRFAVPNLRAWFVEKLFNTQTRPAADRNVRHHYQLGDDLFTAMLDPRMVYSCGYWRNAQTLAEAQEAKLDLICRKLDLQPGMTFLDIGCGWGGLVQYAAERCGCRCIGITLSPDQARIAVDRCRGLPVEIRLQDYRDIEKKFDRVASVGMFEHVGQKNHRTYMQAVRRALKDDGLALIHFFATQRDWPNLRDSEVLWIKKHIFPGMVVPTLSQIGAATRGLLILEDLHNFGADYDPTLMAWFENFHRAWPRLRDKYGDRFYRVWKYYLLICAGAFRSRKYQLWQVVLSPRGKKGGYLRPTDLAELEHLQPQVITCAQNLPTREFIPQTQP
jgi:cyclopropane-fatty-acyl-phospholipid synthase